MRTVYCVQRFSAKTGALSPKPVRQFGTEGEALAAGREMPGHVVGAVVFSIEGSPTTGYWSEPRRLAVVGRVPSEWRCDRFRRLRPLMA